MEARARITDILSKVPKPDGLGPHAHRQLRAVFILEKIGTPACKQILESLEKEAVNVTVKSRAKEAALKIAAK